MSTVFRQPQLLRRVSILGFISEHDALPRRELPVDTAQSRNSEVRIRGKRVPYRVTIGTQPVSGSQNSSQQ